jgi:hypothetical protein
LGKGMVWARAWFGPGHGLGKGKREVRNGEARKQERRKHVGPEFRNPDTLVHGSTQ